MRGGTVAAGVVGEACVGLVDAKEEEGEETAKRAWVEF